MDETSKVMMAASCLRPTCKVPGRAPSQTPYVPFQICSIAAADRHQHGQETGREMGTWLGIKVPPGWKRLDGASGDIVVV